MFLLSAFDENLYYKLDRRIISEKCFSRAYHITFEATLHRQYFNMNTIYRSLYTEVC